MKYEKELKSLNKIKNSIPILNNFEVKHGWLHWTACGVHIVIDCQGCGYSDGLYYFYANKLIRNYELDSNDFPCLPKMENTSLYEYHMALDTIKKHALVCGESYKFNFGLTSLTYSCSVSTNGHVLYVRGDYRFKQKNEKEFLISKDALTILSLFDLEIVGIKSENRTKAESEENNMIEFFEIITNNPDIRIYQHVHNSKFPNFHAVLLDEKGKKPATTKNTIDITGIDKIKKTTSSNNAIGFNKNFVLQKSEIEKPNIIYNKTNNLDNITVFFNLTFLQWARRIDSKITLLETESWIAKKDDEVFLLMPLNSDVKIEKQENDIILDWPTQTTKKTPGKKKNECLDLANNYKFLLEEKNKLLGKYEKLLEENNILKKEIDDLIKNWIKKSA